MVLEIYGNYVEIKGNKSLEKLVGKRQVKKIFQNVEKTIPKLSGALCYVISEIGSRLGDMESDENDES